MTQQERIKTLLSIAHRKHTCGDLAEAELLYREIILADPLEPQVKNHLGFLLQQTNRLSEAFEQITAALTINSQHSEWHFNLGIVLSKQGYVCDAITAFTNAIALDSEKYYYWTNLGINFEKNLEIAHAEECYKRASKINPDIPDAFYLLAALCLKLERFPEARHFNYCGIITEPPDKQSKILRGQAYFELGRVDEAIALLKNWLLAEPDHAVALHLLDAYQGKDLPDRCSIQYIELTFDDFASTFENTLKRLNYCGPDLVRVYLSSLNLQYASLYVLDLGCGTGLLGDILKPYANRLVGVDLSQAMLNLAIEKQLYHHLKKSDITDFLIKSPDTYDLITCMDTFIYLGRLDEIFTLILQRLKVGGHFLFSTEKVNGTNANDYQLNISGRFSHHNDYLITILKNTGFIINDISDVEIRKESGCPILGQFVCATRIQ